VVKEFVASRERVARDVGGADREFLRHDEDRSYIARALSTPLEELVERKKLMREQIRQIREKRLPLGRQNAYRCNQKP
jgi:hypothetical protein